MQIFTADEPEVEALPRIEVARFLESVHPDSCIGFLEHIINDLEEGGAEFHDKLAELYIQDAKKGKGGKLSKTGPTTGSRKQCQIRDRS